MEKQKHLKKIILNLIIFLIGLTGLVISSIYFVKYQNFTTDPIIKSDFWLKYTCLVFLIVSIAICSGTLFIILKYVSLISNLKNQKKIIKINFKFDKLFANRGNSKKRIINNKKEKDI